MGGDFAPAAVVAGAAAAVRELGLPFARPPGRRRAGGSAPSSPRQASCRRAPSRCATPPQVVEMGDHPGQAMRQKKDSSHPRLLRAVQARRGRRHGQRRQLGAMHGRRALGPRAAWTTSSGRRSRAVLPSLKGRTLLLDAGANAECKPVHLVQFALMGEVYARRMLGIEQPRLAVLSNGEEASKGTELTRAAAEALRGFGPASSSATPRARTSSTATSTSRSAMASPATSSQGRRGAAQAILALLRRT